MCRRSARDEALKRLVDNSYQSLRVSPRGRVSIDPAEVRASPYFQRDLQRAKEIVMADSGSAFIKDKTE